ncbi:DUF742 domain-containing protein, partial [Streptomyces pseudogriseolus]|uniref:DUF742 domain-containing protein n=1 Tax=Streptomyces pseudogriseolus TaxID=36817 RepID=UPI003FA31A6C
PPGPPPPEWADPGRPALAGSPSGALATRGHAGPEVRAIWELCSGGYLSVAEVAGHLGLPVGVARLLLTDLSEQGHLLRRAEPPRAQNVDRATLEKVLHGLQSLIG